MATRACDSMAVDEKKRDKKLPRLSKARTGIEGLDETTAGGRPTIICGSAGSGKTVLAVEFLVRGATQFGEHGVFMMLEENAAELSTKVRSLGFDLDKFATQKLIALDHVQVERSEIEEPGEYDLEGLFIRFGYAIAKALQQDHDAMSQQRGE